MKELNAEYGEKVEFLVVYITEAHALDGASPISGNGAPIVEEPTTLAERRTIAHRCDIALGLAPMKVLLDDMDNTAGSAYSGHPDRLYLVDKEGRISYAGDRGPFGFKPDELEDAIRVDLKMPAIERKQEEEQPRRRRGGR